MVQMFGFEIKKRVDPVKEAATNKTFAPPQEDDGAITVTSGSHYGTYVDMDGIIRNEVELITRYREMSMQPEIESAIDEIINEAIVTEDNGKSVELNVDELKQPEAVRKKITDEFATILKLLGFGANGHDTFKRWYVDGRLFYHVVIDETNPRKGIQEIRYIDPRRIRKIREIQKSKDATTSVDVIKAVNEYYLYNERGIIGAHSNMGVKIAVDSIVNVNSGLMDSRRAMVLSYLHKAIKPLNQVRMVEDATVIYRMSRAPERRIFYVDVGNMPTIKAEQYLRDIMTKYRNKLVYDSATGEIRDDRKHMSMLEDFWLPRREGSRGTEITTLEGGQNLGKMEDVEYFEKKLYKSLGVPMSRLDNPSPGFSLGRTTEITRDELKFAKFVSRLRSKFSGLFDDLLRVQLVLKRICTEEEWNEFKEDIWYDFLKDNNFDEMKETELLTNRITALQLIEPFVGRYFSKEWIRRNLLKQNDEDIEEIDKQMEEEADADAANMKTQGIDPSTGMPQIDPNDPEQQQQQQLAGPQQGQAQLPPPQQEKPPKFQVKKEDIEFAK